MESFLSFPLTELNEQFAITSPLIRRQGQDTGNIVIFCWLFFLQKDASYDQDIFFKDNKVREYI